MKGLTKTQVAEIRKELELCKRPLYFFHDDPDGLCSFLLLYRYLGEGKGIPVKSQPGLDMRLFSKIEEYQPDKVIILDMAVVEEEFLENISVPVIWIDHHEPRKNGVKYYNPRVRDSKDGTCVSELCYQVVDQDLWVAMIGIVGDWQLPDHLQKQFSCEYPALLPKGVVDPGEAMFATRLGEIVKIFSFILKGKIQQVMSCVKILTRMEEPEEFFSKTSSRSRFLYKHFKTIKQQYNELLKDALKTEVEEGILLYLYPDDKMSFTKELSNEALFNNPEAVVIIGRKKDGEVKLSLRGAKVNVRTILGSALNGVQGYGGGHEHACGACVKEHDFPRFIDQIKKELSP